MADPRSLQGNMGLPFVGETWAFASNPAEFVETRAKQFECPFKTRIIGQNVAFCSSHASVQKVLREEGHANDFAHSSGYSFILEKPYGSMILTQNFDDKRQNEEYLAVFRDAASPGAATRYSVAMRRIGAQHIGRMLDKGDTIELYTELKHMFSHLIGNLFMDLEASEIAKFEEMAKTSFNGATSVPIDVGIPSLFSTKFSKMRSANEDLTKRISRLLKFFVDSKLRTLQGGGGGGGGSGGSGEISSSSRVPKKPSLGVPRTKSSPPAVGHVNSEGGRVDQSNGTKGAKASPEFHDTFIENTAQTIASMAHKFSTESKLKGRKLSKATEKYTKDLISHASRHILLFVGGFATKALSSLVTSVCWLLAQPQHGDILEDLRDEVQLFVEKSRETKFDVGRLNKLELLDQHGDILEDLRDEVQLFVEKSRETKFDVGRLNKLELLDQVLLETQRLFPPIIGGSRGCERDTEVNGKCVEKGWKVWFSMFAANRDPAVYDDPEAFRPSRWASSEKLEKRHLAFAWGSDRPCMGQHMSVTLVKTFLVQLLNRYEWSLEPGQDLTLKYLPVVRPLSNLRVHLSRRRGRERGTSCTSSF